MTRKGNKLFLWQSSHIALWKHSTVLWDMVWTDRPTRMQCRLYLQKFLDDHLMKTMLKRMSGDDLTEIFEIAGKMLKKYLTEPGYHQLFLKEEE